MAMVQFKKGLFNSLPAVKTEGTFYITTDEKAIWLDVSADERIRLGDFRAVADLAALNAIKNPSTEQLFYVTDINVLARWDGADYVQINLDTGATSVEVVGEGNVVTESSYDPTTRKLTLTKGFTAASKAEHDELVEYVGTIPADEKYANVTDVIGFINAKAEETLAAAQGGSSETAASVKLALDNYKEVTDPRLEALEAVDHEHANMTVLNGITAEKVAEWDAKQVAGDYATKAEAQGYANAKDEAIAAAQAAADKAQEDVDTLSGKVGTVPADKTVVQMIADAQEAATFDPTALEGRVGAIESDYLKGTDKTELNNKIQANTEAIGTLNGTGEGSVSKQITDAFNDFSTKVSDDKVINSYKELIDWAAEHGGDAAEMAAAITALQNIVDGIGGEGEKATVVAYVADAISALQSGDLSVVSERLDALEAIDHDAYKGADETVLATAQEYADGLNTAMDTRVKVLEAIDHEAYKAYADQAETDAVDAAKAYADGLADNYDSEGSAAQALDDAKAYTDGQLENYSTTTEVGTAIDSKITALKLDETYDKIGAADAALEAANEHSDGLNTAMDNRVKVLEAIDHNAYVAADEDVLGEAKSYADGLAGNYDAKGAAATAETNSKAYTDQLFTWGSF